MIYYIILICFGRYLFYILIILNNTDVLSSSTYSGHLKTSSNMHELLLHWCKALEFARTSIMTEFRVISMSNNCTSRLARFSQKGGGVALSLILNIVVRRE